MITVLEELSKHQGILSQFLREIMKLVDLMEAMGIMKNLYTKVKWSSIAPMRES